MSRLQLTAAIHYSLLITMSPIKLWEYVATNRLVNVNSNICIDINFKRTNITFLNIQTYKSNFELVIILFIIGVLCY